MNNEYIKELRTEPWRTPFVMIALFSYLVTKQLMLKTYSLKKD